jgi:DNA-binding IclR family transcriptional regulator
MSSDATIVPLYETLISCLSVARERETPESAVARALSLITAFTFADPVLGVSELGRRLHLPKSTVHRLLGILVNEGFVERTPDERYRLSLKLYEIGQEVVSSHVLRQVGHAPLEKLRNDSGEAAHLAVLSGADVVYLDRFESPQMMGLFTKVGRRRSAHATSSGKVLLAFGSQADVDDAVAAGLPRLGPRTITSRTRLNQTLAEIRKTGYAISSDESAPGVVSVGAPIFDRVGSCVAAVSVAGPLIRMPEDRHNALVRMVVKTAAEISKALTSTSQLSGPAANR